MRVRVLALLIAFSASACGCQSPPNNPLVWIANRLTQTNCVARKRPPGSTWVDQDHGGGWVQLGEEGKVRPIPAPPTTPVRSQEQRSR